jgi:hypothetical protein
VSQLREYHGTDPSSHYSEIPPELLNSVIDEEDEVQDTNSNELSDGTETNNFEKDLTREREVQGKDKQEGKEVEQVNSAGNEVDTPLLDTSLQPHIQAVPPPLFIEPNGQLLPSSHGPHTSQVQLDPTHTPPTIFPSKTIFPTKFLPSAPSITNCLSSPISNLEDKVSSGPDSNVSKQIDQKSKRRIFKPYWDSDFVRK